MRNETIIFFSETDDEVDCDNQRINRLKIFEFDNENHWKIFREIASKVKAEIYSIFYTEIIMCKRFGHWLLLVGKCINQF